MPLEALNCTRAILLLVLLLLLVLPMRDSRGTLAGLSRYSRGACLCRCACAGVPVQACWSDALPVVRKTDIKALRAKAIINQLI